MDGDQSEPAESEHSPQSPSQMGEIPGRFNPRPLGDDSGGEPMVTGNLRDALAAAAVGTREHESANRTKPRGYEDGYCGDDMDLLEFYALPPEDMEIIMRNRENRRGPLVTPTPTPSPPRSPASPVDPRPSYIIIL